MISDKVFLARERTDYLWLHRQIAKRGGYPRLSKEDIAMLTRDERQFSDELTARKATAAEIVAAYKERGYPQFSQVAQLALKHARSELLLRKVELEGCCDERECRWQNGYCYGYHGFCPTFIAGRPLAEELKEARIAAIARSLDTTDESELWNSINKETGRWVV